jgi:hypothetical protein
MSALTHPPISSPTASPAAASTGDRASLRLLERRPAASRERPASLPVPARPGLLERLARWADHQPTHHRLGSWYPLG